MSITGLQNLRLRGQLVENVALLTDCTPIASDRGAIERQLQTAGYVYLPGFLGRERVIRARKLFIEQLARNGALHPDYDPMEAVANPDIPPPGFVGGALDSIFPGRSGPLQDVLYDGPMMMFFRTLFGAQDVLHFDYTWTRQVKPGPATDIHSDVVYMGRGTHELYTAWTPMGDNGFDIGGLIVLEASNNHSGLRKSYWQTDVDAFCENRADKRDAWQKGTNGSLKGDVNQIRRSLGGNRWLTGDYRMGDVVIFSVFTVHGGTDNSSNKIRISTDTRYQRADQPVDERWIGSEPSAHGPASKRGLIC